MANDGQSAPKRTAQAAGGTGSAGAAGSDPGGAGGADDGMRRPRPPAATRDARGGAMRVSGGDARGRAKAEGRAAIHSASLELEHGAIDEATWYRRVTGALASAYLLEDDPRWQSGFDGDPDLWRQARELVLDAVGGDGTFLDVGCATGHLMECLAGWALERRRHLAMYGLELSPELAAAARRRLPVWADRIFEGNAIDWTPPCRFTYVRTGLEYVPPPRRPFLITRLLRDVVEPGGRLIVGPVSGQDFDAAAAAFAAAGFPEPATPNATDRNGKRRYVLWVGWPGGTVRP